MTYELWFSKPEEEMAYIPGNHPQKHDILFPEGNWELKWTCEADSWEEAMRKMHERMERGPYVPLEA